MKIINTYKKLCLSIIVSILGCITIFSQTYYFTNENQNIPLSATIINSMDVESADVDNDGDLDLVIAGEFRRNLLLFNDGNGVFTEDATRLFPDKNPNDNFLGEDSEDIAFADFDLDGDLDVFFATEDTANHELLINDGTGKFTFINYNFPSSLGEAVVVLDLNNDDYPDIIIGVNGQNRVYINNQDLTFTEDATRWQTNTEGTQDLKLVDLDNDNDLDIIEGIDSRTNNIWMNTNGFFAQENNRLPDLDTITIETRKITLGDINNDGFIDLYYSNVNFNGVANMQDRLFLNDGSGFFTDITSTNFPVYVKQTLDAIFIDYDFDGDLDLLSVGFLDATLNYHFFENDGNGIFTESTSQVVAPFTMTGGIALHQADFNNDTYPDIYIGGFQQTDNILFSNSNALFVEEYNGINQLSIYPNPTTDFLHINFNNTSNYNLSIFDYTGKLIHQKNGLTSNYIWNRNGIANGVYFISVATEDGKFMSQKIILK